MGTSLAEQVRNQLWVTEAGGWGWATWSVGTQLPDLQAWSSGSAPGGPSQEEPILHALYGQRRGH